MWCRELCQHQPSLRRPPVFQFVRRAWPNNGILSGAYIAYFAMCTPPSDRRGGWQQQLQGVEPGKTQPGNDPGPQTAAATPEGQPQRAASRVALNPNREQRTIFRTALPSITSWVRRCSRLSSTRKGTEILPRILMGIYGGSSIARWKGRRETAETVFSPPRRGLETGRMARKVEIVLDSKLGLDLKFAL